MPQITVDEKTRFVRPSDLADGMGRAGSIDFSVDDVVFLDDAGRIVACCVPLASMPDGPVPDRVRGHAILARSLPPPEDARPIETGTVSVSPGPSPPKRRGRPPRPRAPDAIPAKTAREEEEDRKAERKRAIVDLAAGRAGKCGPLTDAQKETLQRLWIENPAAGIGDIGAMFEEATGRSVSAPTVASYRPDRE